MRTHVRTKNVCKQIVGKSTGETPSHSGKKSGDSWVSGKSWGDRWVSGKNSGNSWKTGKKPAVNRKNILHPGCIWNHQVVLGCVLFISVSLSSEENYIIIMIQYLRGKFRLSTSFLEVDILIRRICKASTKI